MQRFPVAAVNHSKYASLVLHEINNKYINNYYHHDRKTSSDINNKRSIIWGIQVENEKNVKILQLTFTMAIIKISN